MAIAHMTHIHLYKPTYNIHCHTYAHGTHTHLTPTPHTPGTLHKSLSPRQPENEEEAAHLRVRRMERGEGKWKEGRVRNMFDKTYWSHMDTGNSTVDELVYGG